MQPRCQDPLSCSSEEPRNEVEIERDRCQTAGVKLSFCARSHFKSAQDQNARCLAK